MSKRKTREITLYRLVPQVRGTLDDMFDAFAEDEKIRDLEEPQITKVADAPAIWFEAQEDEDTSSWCADAAVTTGLDIRCKDRRSGGLLVLGVDGTAYALSYGNGYKLIPDGLKDERFGMSFLIRRLDARQVSGIVRRRPDARGRTDSTLVAAGAPVGMLGVAENVEIIRRIGGKASGDLKVTFAAQTGRKVKIEGAAGLRMRFGVAPGDLIADIRECARVCAEEEPRPALEFIEYIQPITDPVLTGVLDSELGELLTDDCENVVPVVPTALLDRYDEAHSLTIRLGGHRTIPVATFGLDDILRCVRNRPPDDRTGALRTGRIILNRDDNGTDDLGETRAIKWIEASVSLGSERFFLMDGDWFQIGAEYARASRDAIRDLFPEEPSIELPPWSLADNRTEYDYNTFVAARSLGGFLCLDKNRWVRDPLGARSPLEICDLLGPADELIHVKRAEGSAPLSHLFFQGLISAQSLMSAQSSVRERFVQTVAGMPHARNLDPAFTPKKVIYAILMDNGKQLTPDTLFPFSQASLAHAARILRTYGIEVEVIGIPAG